MDGIRMITVNVASDNRPSYLLDTDKDEYKIENVTSVQNLDSISVDIFDQDGKQIIIEPKQWVRWDSETFFTIKHIGYKIKLGLR